MVTIGMELVVKHANGLVLLVKQHLSHVYLVQMQTVNFQEQLVIVIMDTMFQEISVCNARTFARTVRLQLPA